MTDSADSVVSRPGAWARRYARRLALTDALAVVIAFATTQLVWFAPEPWSRPVAITPGSELSGVVINYSAVSAGLILIWLLALTASDTRAPRVIGVGIAEYSRVVGTGLWLFAVVAILAVLAKVDIARGYFVGSFLLAVVLLVGSRWLWRQWLVRRRRRGEMSSRTLVVGSPSSIMHIQRQFVERFPYVGYQLIGVCVTLGSEKATAVGGIPVLGALVDLKQIVKRHEIDTVIVTASEELTPDVIRRLSWDLEDSRVELAVSPALLDVVGPRVHTRSVAGAPLLHIDVPEYEGLAAVGKAVFDRVLAAVGVVLIAPVLAALALGVKVSSPGPVLYRQERIGLNGRTFEMLKFRSMVVGADRLVDQLQESNDADGALFKMRDDPRVTRYGRFIRKHSLDELPQLFNVLRGDMSLVGPRPPLPHEVEAYEAHVMRRFLVRPGLTGPWQVSGRSDLPWDDAVRLDLYYVENWSITGDLIYLWRTVKVVLGGRGGY